MYTLFDLAVSFEHSKTALINELQKKYHLKSRNKLHQVANHADHTSSESTRYNITQTLLRYLTDTQHLLHTEARAEEYWRIELTIVKAMKLLYGINDDSSRQPEVPSLD